MDFQQVQADCQTAVKKCIENITKFEGRASRPDFWWVALCCFVISFVGSILDSIIGMGLFGMLTLLVNIGLIAAVGARRMHDVGQSGWFMLIPLYNLYLAAQEGEKGENAYGAPAV